MKSNKTGRFSFLRATIMRLKPPRRLSAITAERRLRASPERLVPLATAALLLSGCVVGPDFQTPNAPGVAGYTAETALKATSATAAAGGTSQSFVTGRDIPKEWWALFRSRQINALVEEATHNHPDVQAAQFALRSARESVRAEQGALFPQVSANGSATREQTSLASAGESGPASLYNLYSASVSVSYTLDVFGGTRRQIESLQAQADYQRFELEATYLALTANVVTAAITDASLRAQIAATKDIIKAETDQLARIRGQFELGGVAQSDVLSQQSTLLATEATLPPLQKQLAQQRDQLMAYLGRLPSEDRGEGVDLSALHLPRALPVSLPSALVRQRPDIREAEATLHQATANVGVAIADMLPQVTLSGSAGSSALSAPKLFSPQTITWSVASSVSQKIFDGGTLFHTKEADVATYQQDLAKYKSAVLTAFQNVADALRAVQSDADTLKADAASEKVALDSLAMAEQQYKAGAVAYSTIIADQQTYQNAVISRVKAQATRFADTAALFQALGGGWWNRIDETPDAAPRVAPGYLAGPEQQTREAAKETAR
jgi:NodT family efflux transporter outer membrane factor (OMF) lipoprotein